VKAKLSSPPSLSRVRLSLLLPSERVERPQLICKNDGTENYLNREEILGGLTARREDAVPNLQLETLVGDIEQHLY